MTLVKPHTSRYAPATGGRNPFARKNLDSNLFMDLEELKSTAPLWLGSNPDPSSLSRIYQSLWVDSHALKFASQDFESVDEAWSALHSACLSLKGFLGDPSIQFEANHLAVILESLSLIQDIHPSLPSWSISKAASLFGAHFAEVLPGKRLAPSNQYATGTPH